MEPRVLDRDRRLRREDPAIQAAIMVMAAGAFYLTARRFERPP